MFHYYLVLAVRNFRRSLGVTILMVLIVAFGIAASMTTYAVFRAVSGDPIPWKSARLFVPQIGASGAGKKSAISELPPMLDYGAATTFLRDKRAAAQVAIYKISPAVTVLRAGTHPAYVDGHAVSSDFFSMFDVPFLYGSGWTHDGDDRSANVAVISSRLNEKLFYGSNSVGLSIVISGRSYRIVGVMRHWDPQPRFYDVVNSGGFSTTSEDIFLPFSTAIASGVQTTGNTDCDETPGKSGIAGLVASNCTWISYIVQLNDASSVAAFRQYLDGYASQLRDVNGASWTPQVKLRDLPHWLDAMHVIPPDTSVSLLVSLGLLVVCLVNTAGLLLAKFQRRGNEIGVRRAIGASRNAIFAQFITESAMVGLAGGLAGVLLTVIGVACVHVLLPAEIASLAQFDMRLLLGTITLAIVSVVLAGAYPAFRATAVQPTLQLKAA